MTRQSIFGSGLATFTPDGQQLDAWFPAPRLVEDQAEPSERLAEGQAEPSERLVEGQAEPSERLVGGQEEPAPRRDALLTAATGADPLTGLRRTPVSVQADLDEPPRSISDAYLRLHALSHRLVAPGTINLSNIFGLLPNNVWTNYGPLTVELVNRFHPELRDRGTVFYGIDRFARMLDYVTLPDVRIADASRVRLGAHLAPGTVVMHEGFVNFNAGTLGVSMIEGRISQGVVVGAGSDIGGGASIMGTLSGGGKQQVRIGKRTLLGANAGTGISLGDNVVVEAGLYLTLGTKVQLLDFNDGRGSVKASELAGQDNILFRRNSVTGAVEALQRPAGSGAVELNESLHG